VFYDGQARSLSLSPQTWPSIIGVTLAVGCGVSGEPDSDGDLALLDEADTALVEETLEEPTELALPRPEVTLRWPAVHDADAAFESGEPATTLEVVNHGDRELWVDLHVGGDAGSTAGSTYEAGSIEVAAGASETIEIDLSPYLAKDAVYSSSVGVRGRLYDPASGDHVGQVMSLPLYFHALEGGDVALYNDTVLREVFAAGDFAGVAADDPTYTAAPLEGEGSAVSRIVAWAPQPGEEAELHEIHRKEASRTEPEGASSGVAGGHDSITTSANATDYLHNLCVRINVETWDSGDSNPIGDEEDVWIDANDGIQVEGLGMLVAINLAPFTTARSTYPGCVSFTTTSHTFTATITGYADFTSSNGSYVRLHNGSNTTQDNYPGSTYSYQVTGVEFIGSWPTYVDIGSTDNPGERLWTGAAAFMKSLMRYDDGLPANTEIHVSPNGDCNVASMQYGNDFINNESYIRVEGYTCAGSDMQSKYLVAHEYGHSLGSQRANAVISPDSETHSATPKGSCEFTTEYGTYGTDTKEWSSASVREGWAHFVSARVWNDKAAGGKFRWEEVTDLDRWNAANDVRGYLKNECCPGSPGTNCPGSLDGAGTIGDWLRAFWDLHSQDCSDAPNKLEMTDLYSEIANSSGLANDNFWPKSATAVASLFPACEADWDTIGCHNGIDQQGGAGQYGSCP
jgi:hypothetical protein